MIKSMVLRILGTLLVVGVMLAPLIQPNVVGASSPEWTIEGDTVFIDDANVFLSATPHTLSSSGWVEFTIRSKSYSGEVDVGWGFSTPGASVSAPQIWRDARHVTYDRADVEKSYTIHNITDYIIDYVVAPDDNYPIYGNSENNSLLVVCDEFPDGVVVRYDAFSGNMATMQIDYTVTETQEVVEYYDDWDTIDRPVNSTSALIEESNRWDLVYLDAPITAGVTYTVRVWIDVPFNQGRSSGKYFFGLKPHNETMAQAKDSGHLYYLDPWWDNTWNYRNPLAFNATALTENLTNFPVTVFLNPSRVDFSLIAANGTDIRFTDSDNITQLPYHITQWNDTPGSENATIVVQVPQIDLGTTFTDYITMYYGNPGATDGQDKNAVWASINAAGVWPMYTVENNGATVFDSTANGNNGTVVGAGWTTMGRDIVYRDFIDLRQGGSVPADLDFGDASLWTLEGWFNYLFAAGSATSFYTGKQSYLGIVFRETAAPRYMFRDEGGAYNNLLGAAGAYSGVWTHLSFSSNGTHITLRINGAHQATILPTNDVRLEVMLLGAAENTIGTNGWEGTAGETRVYSDNRSLEETRVTYMSEEAFWTGHDGGFIQYGAVDLPIPPTVVTLPVTGATMDRDGVTGGTFNGNLTSINGTVNYWWEYGETVAYGGVSANASTNVTGVVTAPLPVNLTPGATYNFRFVGQSTGGTTNGTNDTFTLTMPTPITGASVLAGSTVTLAGSVTDAGVASDSYTFFEYGTAPGAYTATTASTILAGAGDFSSLITAPNSDSMLYYRSGVRNGAVVAYSAESSLAIPSGIGGFILKQLLRVVLAGIILVGAIRLGAKGGAQLLVVVVVGVLAFTIVDGILNLLF